jgi:hypothetical protein
MAAQLALAACRMTASENRAEIMHQSKTKSKM